MNNGFVLWFTGLSGAGKTTLADMIFDRIKENNNVKIERLDGDIVRTHLTKGLDFSKEGRDENIRRISFVANLLSRNGVIVVASFISPYRYQRKKLKKEVNNFVEIFVNAPLSLCEKRDVKGYYKKARKGEIKQFTGITDPYDLPSNPDIEVKTDIFTPSECIEQILKYLKDKNLL